VYEFVLIHNDLLELKLNCTKSLNLNLNQIELPICNQNIETNTQMNNMINENRNMGPGIFHTTVPNKGPVNLGHFEPRSFGFLIYPMNLRNQQPNRPILFSTGNQITALQPQINYGFQPNGQYFQSPAGFNGNHAE
jgi:hypothetical protein